MKILGFLKKHIKLLIVVLIIAIVVILNIKKKNADMRRAMMESYDGVATETIERQNISNYVSITGKIVANDSQTVYSTVNEREVLSVKVEVGDYVEKGDVIAVLDSSEYEKKLATAEKELSVQRQKDDLKLKQAADDKDDTMIDAVDSAKDNQTEIDNAAADYGYVVRDKEYAYKDYQDAVLEYEDAKSEYKEAKSKYDKLKKRGGSVRYAGVTYTEEGDKDDNDKNALKKVVENLESEMDDKEDKMESARRSYERACQDVEKTGRSYDKAVESAADTAESNQRKIDEANDAYIEKALDTSISTVQQEDQIDQYKKEIEKCTITAPISGVITSVDIEEGDETSNDNNNICVIQDTSLYKVEGTVDEYDVSKITVGMKAVIKTEATGDVEMTGVVSFISPTPKTASSGGDSGSSSSAALYPIKITLDDIDDAVRIGMTAQTSVLLDYAENVLTVPYDCISQNEEGEYVICVSEKSEDMGISQREIVVEKGLETDYYVEISSDEISEGMEVVVPDNMESKDDDSDDFDGPHGHGRGPK